jgi:hypothetical protein
VKVQHLEDPESSQQSAPSVQPTELTGIFFFLFGRCSCGRGAIGLVPQERDKDRRPVCLASTNQPVRAYAFRQWLCNSEGFEEVLTIVTHIYMGRNTRRKKLTAHEAFGPGCTAHQMRLGAYTRPTIGTLLLCFARISTWSALSSKLYFQCRRQTFTTSSPMISKEMHLSAGEIEAH